MSRTCFSNASRKISIGRHLDGGNGERVTEFEIKRVAVYPFNISSIDSACLDTDLAEESFTA